MQPHRNSFATWRRSTSSAGIAALGLFAITALFGSTKAQAEAPPIIPVQGVLTNASDEPIHGDTRITFSLYTNETGVTALWSETQIVSVDQGVFVAYMGLADNLPLTLFRDNGVLWLGIAVESDPEMGRVRLGSTPYTAYAEFCGNIPDHGHAYGDLTGTLPQASLPAGVVLGSQGCQPGMVVTGVGADGALVCATDLDTNTTYSGANFALSDQSCGGGDVVTGIATDGTLSCVPDQSNTYTGADFAVSSQQCNPGDVITGIDAAGQVICDADASNTYSGADFALSGQSCPAAQYQTGVSAAGIPQCAEPARKHVGAVYRWATFHTYHNNTGWLAGNDSVLYGGIHPSSWTDGNAEASQLSADKEVLRTLFTRKGYGGANATVVSNVYLQYSSTTGQMTAALFRVRNTTSNVINWTPYFVYTCYSGWSERASVALNGAAIWNSGGTNCTNDNRTNVTLAIPAQRTSTIVFVSGSNTALTITSNITSRANVLAFYNDSLALPAGLEYVDDLDIATGDYSE